MITIFPISPKNVTVSSEETAQTDTDFSLNEPLSRYKTKGSSLHLMQNYVSSFDVAL